MVWISRFENVVSVTRAKQKAATRLNVTADCELFVLSSLLVFDQIDPLCRTRHARRAEVVVNRSRGGSGGTLNTPRVVLEGDDVSAGSRRIERHGHRAGRGVLRDSFRLGNTA